MSAPLQSIRGMHDETPATTPSWLALEASLSRLATLYGYQQIRTPLLEANTVFNRSLGEETDVICKEMYSFEDRNGQVLSLRPEGTASCVRAGIQHGLFHNQVQSLWYLGPMFRRERPQKGRLRQFHQFGVELFGMPSVQCEVELIAFSQQLWQILGIKDLTLEINTLGTADDRKLYRETLINYFEPHLASLNSDEQRRLRENPLRLLDSKNPALKPLIDAAPLMSECLSADSHQRFETWQSELAQLGITFTHNPYLVRGLDYYNDAVFEWKSQALGAQGTICAGGRYDGLVAQMGGQHTPAVGMAMGLERILALLNQNKQRTPSLFILSEMNALDKQQTIAQSLRNTLPNCIVKVDHKGGSLKSQLKRAIKHNATWAVVLSENGAHQLKFLKQDLPTQTLSEAQLTTWITQLD